MGAALLTALGLVLLLEGLMPLLAPRAWRETFERVMRLTDGQLRFLGLVFVLVGLFLVWL